MSSESNQTMHESFYGRQSTLIQELNSKVRILEGRNRYLEFYEKPGKYYMEMQKATLADDRLMEIWNSFIVFWKLSTDIQFDEPITDIEIGQTYCETCNQQIFGK